jgi:hypothetical protein
MADKIDDAKYNEGRADFDNGLSLRTIAKGIAVADTPAEEDAAFSRLLGFADAVLDRLRSVTHAVPLVIENCDGTVSLLATAPIVDGSIRAYRSGDVFRGSVQR